jgi:hypothetical protein
MKKTLVSLTMMLVLLAAASAVYASPAEGRNFVAPLNGDEEVPLRDTNARGLAKFQLSREGGELGYKLIVANIENVAAAHIHCAPMGVNGPVGVTLFVGSPGSGRFDGVLAEGTITAPDSGNGCGWMSLDDVLDAMRSGSAYVNVHTNDRVAPPNTGPGDFPGGEIRGQIR